MERALSLVSGPGLDPWRSRGARSTLDAHHAWSSGNGDWPADAPTRTRLVPPSRESYFQKRHVLFYKCAASKEFDTIICVLILLCS